MNEYLVIDKIGDFLYFKDQHEIAKYFNITKPQVDGICQYCRRRLVFPSPSHHIYIQRLFNNTHSPVPKNTHFIWDDKERKKHLTAYSYWNTKLKMTA